MTKKEKRELKKIQEEVGAVYELDGNESFEELKEMEKEIVKDTKKGEEIKTEITEKEETKKNSGKLYLWLKTRAYVSDEKRIDPGLYCMAKGEMYPRLEKANATVLEIFEDKIPSRKLTEIARHCGVDSDKYEEDEDLLKVLLTSGIREF